MLSHSDVSDSLWPKDCNSPGSSLHGDSSGKNTGMVWHTLLQGFLPIQGLNPALLHCKRIFYFLNHQGSPRVLEWVAYPFFTGTSWPRNWTGVSCTADGFFTSSATREAQYNLYLIFFFFFLSFLNFDFLSLFFFNFILFLNFT